MVNEMIVRGGRFASITKTFDMDNNNLVKEVVDFWFGSSESAEFGKRRQIWFQSTADFDREIKQRFSEANRLASAGELDSLTQPTMGTLALIILLDQFSRNIFRRRSLRSCASPTK